MLIFSDLPAAVAKFVSLAALRLKNGFCPSTFKQYSRMWHDLLSFHVAAGLSLSQVIPLVLLAYIQYLINAYCSEAYIANNCAALRSFHIIHGLPTDSFQDQHIRLLLKSVNLIRSLAPKLPFRITIETLQQVIASFSALYSFIFFFLHLSKLLPHTSTQYDFTKHMKSVKLTRPLAPNFLLELQLIATFIALCSFHFFFFSTSFQLIGTYKYTV